MLQERFDLYFNQDPIQQVVGLRNLIAPSRVERRIIVSLTHFIWLRGCCGSVFSRLNPFLVSFSRANDLRRVHVNRVLNEVVFDEGKV